MLTKYSVLMQATSNGKSASPMYYDKKAFHSNEVYKSVIEVENQGTTYIDAKTQQAEARRLQEKAEEEANKPWYEKHGMEFATLLEKSLAIMIIKSNRRR